MDISNVRNAVDGCEGEFLSYMLNLAAVDLIDGGTAFKIEKDFYADDIVDEMVDSDPDGFASCVIEFIQDVQEKGAFIKLVKGDDDASPA